MKYHRKLFKEIRFQMVLAFGVVTIVLAVLLTLVCVFNLYEWARNEAVSDSVAKASQFSLRAQVLMDEASKVLRWGRGENCYQFLIAEGNKQKEGMALIRDMITYRSSSLVDESVYNVYLFDIDGRSYDERKGVYFVERYEKSLHIFDAVRTLPDTLIHVMDEQGDRLLIYGAAVAQPGTGKPIGYVAIEFRNSFIEQHLQQESRELKGRYAVYDPGLGFIAGDDKLLQEMPAEMMEWVSQPGDDYMMIREGHRERLVLRNEISGTGWRLLCASYMDELTPQTGRIMQALVVIVCVTVLAGIFAYVIVMNRMMQPIIRMREHMRQAAGGNLDAIVEENSQNEFAVLESQYNRMLGRIRELIEQNKEDQKSLQKAEFATLQAQIAPHFLYNTLDTIIWLVAVGENEKAMEMIENLSIFFKTGLSHGMDWFSVATEIEHVRSYLFIQQSRYSDMLTYEINVDESMLEYDMLKMILQPIVENAIYHGIKNKEGGGGIEIRGFIEGDYLCFTVKDNGIGMEESQVKLLNSRMVKNEQGFQEMDTGFGLYNVNRRIRLYYGADCGLTVKSTLDEGTEVLIRLRKQTGLREDDA